jgi:hypothetical protein
MHSSTAEVPRKLRFRFWDIRVWRWLVPADRCFALPEAVSRNRFLVPLCVFLLGHFRMTPFLSNSRRASDEAGSSMETS